MEYSVETLFTGRILAEQQVVNQNILRTQEEQHRTQAPRTKFRRKFDTQHPSRPLLRGELGMSASKAECDPFDNDSDTGSFSTGRVGYNGVIPRMKMREDGFY
jgi:hypothetical protein